MRLEFSMDLGYVARTRPHLDGHDVGTRGNS